MLRVRRLIWSVLVALLALGAGGVARTSDTATPTITLHATDDGYVDASRAKKSFGTSAKLQVDAKPAQRSYLKFDLSPVDGRITRALLKLTATSSSTAGFAVRRVGASSWRERTLTYANAPAVGRSIGRVGAFASKQVLFFDVTASVRAGIRSFALVDRGSATTLSVASSENNTAAYRPQLVVTSTPSGPCGTVTAPPKSVAHVVWIWMENKPYDAIVGSSAAPFENQLAAQCGLATNDHGVTHPSLPNYIAATSGDTQGIADDNPPSSHRLGVASIYSQVKAAGKTWRDYEEDAPGKCPLNTSGEYAVKHDPAPYYTGISGDCAAWDVPLGTTTSGNFLTDLTDGTLPAFSFVTPNLCNDTHDCPVAMGDAWLKSWFAKILASPNYTARSTVVFVTWDEDDGSASNRIATIVVSPWTPAGTLSAASFDHYSLLKTTEELLGITTFLGRAGDSATASMAPAFNLR